MLKIFFFLLNKLPEQQNKMENNPSVHEMAKSENMELWTNMEPIRRMKFPSVFLQRETYYRCTNTYLK